MDFRNKKLTKARGGKVCGVCLGLSYYLEVDVTLVRLLWILFGCMGGAGLLAYIVAAIVMPYEDEVR